MPGRFLSRVLVDDPHRQVARADACERGVGGSAGRDQDEAGAARGATMQRGRPRRERRRRTAQSSARPVPPTLTAPRPRPRFRNAVIWPRVTFAFGQNLVAQPVSGCAFAPSIAAWKVCDIGTSLELVACADHDGSGPASRVLQGPTSQPVGHPGPPASLWPARNGHAPSRRRRPAIAGLELGSHGLDLVAVGSCISPSLADIVRGWGNSYSGGVASNAIRSRGEQPRGRLRNDEAEIPATGQDLQGALAARGRGDALPGGDLVRRRRGRGRSVSCSFPWRSWEAGSAAPLAVAAIVLGLAGAITATLLGATAPGRRWLALVWKVGAWVLGAAVARPGRRDRSPLALLCDDVCRTAASCAATRRRCSRTLPLVAGSIGDRHLADRRRQRARRRTPRPAAPR